ncbi:3-oxoacyl-[acyl-carrier-protein] synthase III C-terminal domain-containing protein [Microbulbifer sp. ALW1]|uniref:3-oxoacyl-[acyl-carrier-protein] synthase III C-terminal domain-containing protein n=1 Tax=Microbulbifer sp. (strain ALW1) TaxID=1516059 RepID=UPI0013590392|nr:3-oxoacyl-[acyl-carrier-protein] synthase III C-terminal domain-containing protein [Microbulbifer sp. ALW1]
MGNRKVKLVDFHCSDYGIPITNEKLYEKLEQCTRNGLDNESRELYRKLLLESPQRVRHLSHDIEVLSRTNCREQRLALYEKTIRSLMTDAINGLFKKTGKSAKDIDFIVVTSSVGKTMPSAASIVASAFSFPSHAVTLNLGDMACSSGLAALDAGIRFLRSENRPARCLVIALEAVSNLFNQSQDGVIPNVVFGEGCAALLISTYREPALYGIDESVRTISSGNQEFEAIRYIEGSGGPAIRLSRTLPKVAARGIEQNLRILVPKIASTSEKIHYAVTKKVPDWQSKIDYWALHPGGTAVLSGLAKSLKLSKGDLAFSFRVFEQRSNMSSPSIFYVLDEIEKTGPKTGKRVFMMSFGSGFKVNSMILTRIARGAPQPTTALKILRDGDCLKINLPNQAESSPQNQNFSGLGYTQEDDPALAVKQLWKHTLGVDRIIVSPCVLPLLANDKILRFIRESYRLLLPGGSVEVPSKSDHDKTSTENLAFFAKLKSEIQSVSADFNSEARKISVGA